MNRALLIAAALAILSGCAESNSVSEVNVNSETTTHIAGSSTSEENDEPMRVKIISYENEKLTYEYEGQQYTIELPVNVLDDAPYGTGKTVGEKIIDNPFGETTLADLTFNAVGSITRCDVYTPNGLERCTNDSFFDTKGEAVRLEDTEVALKRTGGCEVELYNRFGSVKADLNQLDSYYKADLPETAERIAFTGVRFKGGQLILTMLSVYDHDEESPGGPCPQYAPLCNKEKYSFFGTVESLNEDRAAVLLTDEKTLCDLPRYFTDGELSEGMQVMVTLNAEPELYGSGKIFTDSFAVFHTDPTEYNTSGEEFSKLAYAAYDPVDHFKYKYTLSAETGSNG